MKEGTKLLFLLSCFVSINSSQLPNIIFVLADDVGWSDFGYNHPASPIPTPFIDDLAAKGIQMKQYYTHAVCTPSRASLMTGRYHVNTGLTYVLTPGTLAGLPTDIPTLPMLLKDLGGYSTAMAGKWHLGHAKHSQTPVGRGFQSFTGNYMWDTDSWTKEVYGLKPWTGPMMVDWVTEFDNGTYIHHAEPLHSTEAITRAAQDALKQHTEKVKKNQQMREGREGEEEVQPLFLYVAYTAAHSPLQPMPGHIEKCAHIPHLWRRQFCGMVVGLDEGVRNITNTALETIGENTIMVVTSDNGGSPWFGGMNVPLRGIKTTPLEGGTRVPALIVDFTCDQRYLGSGLLPAAPSSSASSSSSGAASATTIETNAETAQMAAREPSHSRYFYGLMHVSDWLPTLLSFGGVSAKDLPSGLDGFNMRDTLKNVPYAAAVSADVAAVAGTPRYGQQIIIPSTTTAGVNAVVHDDPSFASPRTEVLYEMYHADEYIFDQTVQSYRTGDYKLVSGIIKDTNYYYEAKMDHITHTNTNFITYWAEYILRVLESYFGEGPFDTARLALTHIMIGETLTKAQKDGSESILRLYNVVADPTESKNLANEPYAADIIQRMQARLAEIRANKPKTQEVWVHLERDEFAKTHISGDCSDNSRIKKDNCRFTHAWVQEDENDFATTHTVKERQYSTDDAERNAWTAEDWSTKGRTIHVLQLMRQVAKECLKTIVTVIFALIMLSVCLLYYCCGWPMNRRVDLRVTGGGKRYVPLTAAKSSSGGVPNGGGTAAGVKKTQ